MIGSDCLVFSLPVKAARSDLLAALTATEAFVAEMAAAGLSNADIARLRGCSVNTVGNQLAAVYQKVGVRGRRELGARLASQDRGSA
jgi:DNA-binding CsgD family transcriptional regulator